jgi:protein TonB
MFERYMGAKQAKPNKWLGVIIGVSIGLHALGAVGAVIYSFWKIEKLTIRDSSVLYVAAAMATPPPPPPPPPPPKRKTIKTETKPRPTELIQPSKDPVKELPKETSDEDEDEGEDEGVEGGVKGGVVGGVVGGEIGGVEGGVLGGTGTAPPPPAPEAKIVAQAMIEGSRIAGDKNINLTDPQLVTLRNQAVDKLVVRPKVCLDAAGNVSKVSFSKSSGYPDIDAHLVAGIHKCRYKPYVVAGKAESICMIVTFTYLITK